MDRSERVAPSRTSQNQPARTSPVRRSGRWTTLLAASIAALALCAQASASGASTSRESIAASHAHKAGYSLTPSKTEPYAACRYPAKGHAACLAIAVPPLAARNRAQGKALFGFGREPAAGRSASPAHVSGFDGITPSDLRSAYEIPLRGGSTQTVAIVDAFDDPNAESDLKAYRKAHGLPECTKANGCFKKVNQGGREEKYPVPNAEWDIEISLDVDMVSAVCPECKILLVEANNNQSQELGEAENEAVALNATEISNSWGSNEEPGEIAEDKYYNHPGIPITVAGGDSTYDQGVSYPAASPYVIAVGGTDLTESSGTRGWSEEAWAGTGDGCSEYEEKPKWQTQEGCAHRMDDDVAAVAGTPVSIYDSYEAEELGCTREYAEKEECWALVAGTSVAAPIIAGVEALSSSAFRNEGPEAFYKHQGSLFDVAWGENGGCKPKPEYFCHAELGYDGPTGNGTPDVSGLGGPSVTTGKATEVNGHEFSLHGSVNPEGTETHYRFEYGPTLYYGKSAPVAEASTGAGTADQSVAQGIAGLALGGVYHYRLVATNSAGWSTYGEDRTLSSVGWTAQTVPNPSGGTKVKLGAVSCASGTACMAVGQYEGEHSQPTLAESWNGTEWTVKPTVNLNGSVLAAVSCSAANSCTAVGSYESSEHTPVSLAERWNGTEWSVQTTPSPGGSPRLAGVSCSSATSCMAVGFYVDSAHSNYEVPFSEEWNGTTWSVRSSPIPPNTNASKLESVWCTSSNTCTGVGWQYQPGLGMVPLAERWNGSEWTIQTTPGIGKGMRPKDLTSVSCTASNLCTAVGANQTDTNAAHEALAERWNGTAWSIQSMNTPVTMPTLFSVSCTSASACTAVGGETAHSDVENWNGVEWTGEATPVSTESTALAVSCTSSIACESVGSENLAERRAAAAPYVEAAPPTGLGKTEATLNGVVDPEGAETKYYFEYGPTPSYGTKTAEVGAGSSRTPLEARRALTGLEPATTYHFRLVATNALGTSDGADQAFTTSAVETKTATSVGENGATLNGVVTPWGPETKYYFEYGPTTAYGSKTQEVNLGSEHRPVEVSQSITGLSRTTRYHYRIVASTGSATMHGADISLYTGTSAAAETAPATTVGESGATLNGIVNPWGSETKYYFEYGPTLAYGSRTQEVNLGSEQHPVEASAAIVGLSRNTRYHYRIVASNATATNYGADVSFYTGTPSLQPAEGPKAFPVGFTVSGGSMKLVSHNGLEVKCSSTAGTGEFVAVKEGKLTLKWAECTGPLAQSCSTVKAGEVETKELKSLLAYTDPESKASEGRETSLVLSPASGEVFAEFQCGTVKSIVKGSVVAVVGPLGVKAKKLNLTLEQSRNVQKLLEYEAEGGGRIVAGLSTSTYGGAFEQTGMEDHPAVTLANEEATIEERFSTPYVTTRTASKVVATEANVAGTVDPDGVRTKYHFEYGTTIGYGSSTPEANAGEGVTTLPEAAGLRGLVAGTTYHYRIVASGGGKTAYGSDVSFTTGMPTLQLAKGAGAFPAAFSVSGGAMKFVSKSGFEVKCNAVAGAGKFTSVKEGTLSLKWKECKGPLNLSCKTVVAGEVETKELKTMLAYTYPEKATAEGRETGLVLSPASGNVFAELECGTIKSVIRGAVETKITPLGSKTSAFTLTMTEKKQVNELTRYETESGEAPEASLSSSTGESKWEQGGLEESLTPTLTSEEATIEGV
jgi:hypothetical protein